MTSHWIQILVRVPSRSNGLGMDRSSYPVLRSWLALLQYPQEVVPGGDQVLDLLLLEDDVPEDLLAIYLYFKYRPRNR
jgi:hypothetical protein